MKKLLAVLLSLIVLSIPAFAGCSESTNEYGYLDLSKYEVGDELPIYPDYEFSYKFEDGSVITITDMTVTLEKVNIVEEGGLIDVEYYWPYTVRIKISGYINSQSNSETLRIQLQSGIMSTFLDSSLNENGDILWNEVKYIRYYSPLVFLCIDTDF